MTSNKKILTVNDHEVEFTNERNLLEVIRKAGVDIPTFCYHSALSIYGACRLCLVEVEGTNGRPNMIMAACSTIPQEGMVLHTDTKEIRAMRKVAVELLLANHNVECPTCSRSENCKLQTVARQLGVEQIRYKKLEKFAPIDTSSPSIQYDPNKCVLCGDCIRVCTEVQGVGAINISKRGSNARITPAFGAGLGEVECVNCGQCAAICPTGALIPKQDRHKVWDALYDPTKTVVVQIAPAVRVAVGEYFGAKPGENYAGKLVAALKFMGFKHVYDTCFTADMTIFEEATEFIDRFTKKENLPLFTSCCPRGSSIAKPIFRKCFRTFLPAVRRKRCLEAPRRFCPSSSAASAKTLSSSPLCPARLRSTRRSSTSSRRTAFRRRILSLRRAKSSA